MKTTDIPGLRATRVGRVPEGVRRPLWSVMIPTWNCAGYLGEALRSVLVQDPGEDLMQIEVVDDFSTRDDPEAVVREVGRRRVAFYRQEKNRGMSVNFNTCIERSRGHLVHILHGDDHVLPGYYTCMGELALRRGDLALFACRSRFMDEAGKLLHTTDRLPSLEQGGRDASGFFHTNPVQTPSVTVRRSFYETHGGFLPGLTFTGDCEMWARTVSLGGGIVIEEALADYRIHTGNSTDRHLREAENLLDGARCNAVFAERFPAFDCRGADRELCNRARAQEERFTREGDVAAARANRDYWRANAPAGMRIRRFLEELRARFRG